MEKKNDLTRYEEQSRQRLLQLIQERCSGSQQRFVERTGINKGSVSQYINGKNTPSNVTAKKIADCFGVSPVWIMGFDVPMHDEDKIYYSSEETATKAQELFESKEMKLLFDAAKDSKPEDLQMAADLLKRLKGTNPDG